MADVDMDPFVRTALKDDESTGSLQVDRMQISVSKPASAGLKKLMATWNFDERTKTQLTSMFVNKNPIQAQMRTQGEICFAFWGFPRCGDAWHVLMTFLLRTLNPRVHMGSTTKHLLKEVLMVVPLDRLKINKDAFAVWIEEFLGQFPISAGVVVFAHYLDEQMMACMQRIEAGQDMKSNLMRSAQKDFYRCFVNMCQQRYETERVRAGTGLEFNAENFNRLFEQNETRVRNALVMQQRVMADQQDRFHLEQMVACLRHTHTINSDTADRFFSILRREASHAESHRETTREINRQINQDIHRDIHRDTNREISETSISDMWRQAQPLRILRRADPDIVVD